MLDTNQVLEDPGTPRSRAVATRISVIVPAYNAAGHIVECIAALRAAARPDTEIIVVDDASTDATASLARDAGVAVVRLPCNAGPAEARNRGAGHARGDIFFFVDADVLVSSDAVERITRTFDRDPALGAVFGSYDARPRARGVVSQYRNLLHHYVHQRGNENASTFWAGCGAIRRAAFDSVNGFDGLRFPRPSIEDIDLGVRLRQAGWRIHLDKDLQGTHLKRWTLASVIWTDVTRRAIPWARLILQSKQTPDDLNLKRGQRLSVGLVGFASLVLPLALVRVEFLGLALASLVAVLVLNRDLFAFFARHRSVGFALACLPLHLVYFFYCGVSYALVWTTVRLGSARLSAPARGSR